MYKNKEKQRATERERQRRHRKGVTKDMVVVAHGKFTVAQADRILKGVTEGVTELRFSKSRQAKGRLSEGI